MRGGSEGAQDKKLLVNVNIDCFGNDEGFIKAFKNQFVPKLRKFSYEYELFLFEADVQSLSEIVHTMMSSFRFMGLEDLVRVFNQYQAVDFQDQSVLDSLAQEVKEYCHVLEGKLMAL